MYKKTLLCTALALAVCAPLIINNAQAAASSSPTQAISDTMITAKIKALYAKSPLVNGTDIHVTTVNQNVTLRGELQTNGQYERAITLAESIHGVNGITADKLTVKASDAPLTDAYTTAKVKGTFLKENLFGSKEIEYWPVKVETKDSVVYLSGKVSTAEERSNLIQLAQKVTGVKSVDSTITVN